MTTVFDLKASVDNARKMLSYQGPIKDFVCLNPLMNFQHFDFHDAVKRAGATFGAYSLMDLGFYRKAHVEGRITKSALERVLNKISNEVTQSDLARLMEDLFHYPEGSTERPLPVQSSGVRHLFQTTKGVALSTHATPVLLRLISGYLDQGVAIWSMPKSKDGFFSSVRDLVLDSFKSFPPLDTKIAKSLLKLSPEESVVKALERLLADSAYFGRYISDLVMATPGWAAMINQVEVKPQLLLNSIPVSLVEFVAIGLILDVSVVERDLGLDFEALYVQDVKSYELPYASSTKDCTIDLVKKVWQEAYEWSLYEQALQVVSEPKSSPTSSAKIQAAFCIDDRECSIRRHLESFDPEIETFGTAGFFGMDFFYQYYDDIKPSQNCPIVLTPKHIVRGEKLNDHPITSRNTLFAYMDRFSHTVFGGIIVSQLLGLITVFRLIRAVLSPRLESLGSNAGTREADKVNLKIERFENSAQPSPGQPLEGYSLAEMAERVYGQLMSTGIAKNMADLIIIVAHGSTTVNNTHFAAYDCGACMGKPGSPNARAFAQMANKSEVRKLLSEKGVNIPDSTLFIAALHDTTRDEIQFFDIGELSEHHQSLLEKFSTAAQFALQNNAKERCRRFELVPFNINPRSALRHVRLRSASLFEPRPELTHTGNSFAIVGRRSLTRGYFLDRRAFLNSYDPTLDPNGDILATILGAVVPVGGGINLTYFFSRMDNEIYGAGTKLPHNVVGLLGVSNGVEGDLLTGLPLQMVEVHEPVRLLVLVEHEPDIALIAAKKDPAIFQWIQNEWVKFASVSPSNQKTYVFANSVMELADLSYVNQITVISEIENYCASHRFYIPIAKIAGQSKADGLRKNLASWT